MPVERKRGRSQVWWGIALLLVAVMVGVIAIIGVVSRLGGTFADIVTADAQQTPAQMVLELEPGPYLVYELTAQKRSRGPLTFENGRPVTVRSADVTVKSTDGTKVPVGAVTGFSETVTQGSLEYTGAVRFDVLVNDTYVIKVDTPNTQVLVAPSLASGFRRSIGWFGLGALSFMLFAVGGVLLIVGLVRGRKRAVASVPPGWYQDPQLAGAWRWWDGNHWTDRTR
jgi:hypothetical protein